MSNESVATDNAPLDPRIWKIACVVFIGPFMAQLDSTLVNVSLPTIREQLNASLSAAQWIISGYLLALALMLPLNAWLIDRLGAKRLYLSCFTLFTLASMLCGAAHSMNELIMARLVQGMAGGLMAPLAQTMMARIAGRHLARVVGYASVPVLIAPIIGPVAAGAIVQYANWSWLFYLNVPVGVLGIVLALILLPRDEEVRATRPFDLIGFLLISPAYASVPREKLALATTAVNIVQRLGGPMATTVVAMIMAFVAAHPTPLEPHSFTAAFGFLIGVQVLTLLSALRLPLRIPAQSR